jgi:hypothetical protein
MSDYPPYACKCCGYTNGDMFADFYNYEPTEIQCLEFDAYKKMWHLLNDERKEAKAIIANRKMVSTRMRKPRKKYTKKSPYWAVIGVSND